MDRYTGLEHRVPENQNMLRLTKSQIIQGIQGNVRNEPVEEWGGAVVLWQLTSGQLAEIEAIRVRGLTLTIGDVDISDTNGMKEKAKESLKQSASMTMNLETMTSADFTADAQAVAYALSGGGEHWTLEDVMSLRPAGVVQRLAKVVFEISDVTSEGIAQIAQFRAE